MTQQERAIRSSAAECLTFIAATGENPSRAELFCEDENIGLILRMMAVQLEERLTVGGEKGGKQ